MGVVKDAIIRECSVYNVFFFSAVSPDSSFDGSNIT